MNAERYSECLFAYLYRHYKLTQTSELSAGLPSRNDYALPDEFDETVGLCQCHINRMYRPFFKPVFDKAFSWICLSKENFYEFAKGRCFKLDIDHTALLFLTMSAIISELNLYLFQRDCFRFACFAPKCLDDLFQRSDEITDAIFDPIELPGSSHDKVDGFAALHDYCRALLQDFSKDPDFIPPLVLEVANEFINLEDKSVDSRIKVHNDAFQEEDEEEEENEPDEPILGAYASSLMKKCKLCKKLECSSYLEKFETRFIASL